MPVAEARQQGNHLLQVGREVEDQVVVAERLVLEELDGGHADPLWVNPTRAGAPPSGGGLKSHSMQRAFAFPAQRLIYVPACFCS